LGGYELAMKESQHNHLVFKNKLNNFFFVNFQPHDKDAKFRMPAKKMQICKGNLIYST
jgi:hypothetical protein